MPADRDCRRYFDDLSGFVDKRLSDRRLMQVSEHLIRCPRCAGTVEDLRRVRSRLSSCGEAAPPPSSLTERLQSIAGGESDQPLYLISGARCDLPTRQKGIERRVVRGGLAVSMALVTLLVISLALGKEPTRVTEPVREAREQYYVSLAAINVNEGVGAVLWAREQGAEPGTATQLGPRGVALGEPTAMEEDLALKHLAADDSTFTFSGLQRVWLVDGDGVHRPSDVEINVVAGEGASLTVLDARGERFLSWFMPSMDCCSPGHGTGWSFQTYEVLDTIANRPARVIDAVDDGYVAARWWLDQETGLVLWTERYSTTGYPTLAAGFLQIDYGHAQLAADSTTPGELETTAAVKTPGWCVGMPECPMQLAGLPLVGLAKSQEGEVPQQRLVYSDGVSMLSVSWTEGVLTGDKRLVDDSPGQPLVEAWQVGNGVLSVTTGGSRKLLATACGELPEAEDYRFGWWERVGSGFQRLLGIG